MAGKRDPMETVVAQVFSPAQGRQWRCAESADVLKVLARLETNRPSGWNANFFARSWIAADATLARFHLKDPKASQLDPLTTLHRGAHRVEHCVDGHLSLDFGDVGNLRHFIHDVDLDHA